MTTTPAKSRQQNSTQFIKTMLLLSALLLPLSGQSFAAPLSQSQSDLNAQKLRAEMEAKAKAKAEAEARAVFARNVSGVVNSEVGIYAGKVKSAIQKEFRDFDSFQGFTCELQLKLLSDGLLESVTPKNSPSNDIALCNAAIKAVELAKMPVPPSLEVYNTFNKSGFTIVFKP